MKQTDGRTDGRIAALLDAAYRTEIMRCVCACWSALKIHISDECYGRLERCGLHSHGYTMTLRGEIDIKVVLQFYYSIL